MNITVGELIAFLQPLKPETEIRNLQFEITVSADAIRKEESTPVTIRQAPVVPLTREQWEERCQRQAHRSTESADPVATAETSVLEAN